MMNLEANVPRKQQPLAQPLRQDKHRVVLVVLGHAKGTESGVGMATQRG